MGEPEAGFDFTFWRDGGPGRCLVHRAVLRIVLFANRSECERNVGKLHHRDRAACWECRSS